MYFPIKYTVGNKTGSSLVVGAGGTCENSGWGSMPLGCSYYCNDGTYQLVCSGAVCTQRPGGDSTSKATEAVSEQTTTEQLHAYFNEQVTKRVRQNNLDFGCVDEVALAPLLRAVYDKMYIVATSTKDNPEPSRTLIDVGANDGQEAGALMSIFHTSPSSMCSGLRGHQPLSGVSMFRLLSFEPSPRVFCRLRDHANSKRMSSPEFYAFQVALVDKRSKVKFRDVGSEGNTIISLYCT